MNTPSPFDWLKDLCTHFDWLHSSAQALADGRPIAPSSAIPDHAVGEIMRAFFRIQDTLAAQQAERDALKTAVESRDAEFASLHAEAEAVRRELLETRAALGDTRRTLDDRQHGWEEAEAKWQHDRRVMDDRLAGLEQRLRDVTGRLADHARTLNTVAADLASSASS
jgi:predicted  nucleic acid-binding Zn-ribbon protein